MSEEHELDHAQRQEMAELGPMARRALRRLCTIPMPNLQGAFFGR